NTDLYKSETINRMMAHFVLLLKSIVTTPQQKIGVLSMLAPSEKRALLVDFNNTQSDYPHTKSIVALFEEQVSISPESIALVFEDQHLTYQQLNVRANRLAHYLRNKGVQSETLVPLCIERSFELIIGILGILKAGGAYVPLDVDYPAERISFMLKDTAASIIVSSKESRLKLPVLQGVEIIEIDRHEIIDQQPASNPAIDLISNNLAYVIYTSGSTGRPKGVMVSHGNVVSLVKGVNFISLTKDDVLLSTGSPSFDATTIEYWGMLLNGGRLILCSETKLLDSDLLKNEISARQVNKMWFTSSWFNQLVESDITVFEGLQTIMVGGEKLSEYHINKMRHHYPLIEIINGYGPTENTTFSLTYKINQIETGTSIPIGSPLNNRYAYILDAAEQLVPLGITGEIYLGGAGLSRGYLNQPALTAEKFIADPYSEKPGERLYRTGDLGRWLSDGNIEYMGRIDDQVKVRGYRIELGEIENVLQQSGLVNQSVVLAIDNKEGGSKRLVGYIVPNEDFTKDGMIAFLSSNLPGYMVPAVWVEMESMPLTSNGKIDKRALPDPEPVEATGSIGYAAPRNDLEEKIAAIWQELLDVEKVGIYDNFFELGGDSILTIQLVSRIRRAGYELQVTDIFTYQTIATLSTIIEESSGAAKITGDQELLTGASGLLPIQQWYFEKNTTAISHFNQSVLLGISKSITEAALNRAFELLMKHHDALRFKYTSNGDKWQQEYGNNISGFFSEDLQSVGVASLAAQITAHADKHQRSLDIQKGELIRMVWMQTPDAEKDNRLLVVIHHLAVDGVSWRIILEDLELLLNEPGSERNGLLGQKTTSYRQWYEAVKKYSKSEALLSQQGYWMQATKSYEPLPVDKNGNAVAVAKDMANLSMRLSVDQTRRLIQEVPRVYHTEINDILLCALAGTLAEWSGTSKVVIGLEGHGRESVSESIDTSRTAGWFTTLYPLLLETAAGSEAGNQIK
ncbi:MAG: amino acid adenylation domain-containing protein, partial [Ferruginibacter sp.]